MKVLNELYYIYFWYVRSVLLFSFGNNTAESSSFFHKYFLKSTKRIKSLRVIENRHKMYFDSNH